MLDQDGTTPVSSTSEQLLQKASLSEVSFPKLTIPVPGNIPIELLLYSQMDPGSAKQEMARSHALQLEHPTYTNLFFEASTKVCNTQFVLGEKTAIYTFLVGKHDLEFHRHEGHRVIIGTVGSGGAYMRFSHATPEEANSDPIKFMEKMSVIEMPPDSRFVLRFSGKVYHQFGPKDPNIDAIFAISVHTDETGGLSGEVLDVVLRDGASIPVLTEPLSKETQKAISNPELVAQYADFYSLTDGDRFQTTVTFPESWELGT